LLDAVITDPPPRSPRATAVRRDDVVLLLDADPELGVDLSGDDLSLAGRLTVPRVSVRAGPWLPGAAPSRALGVLVLDGILLGERPGPACSDVHLLGPGDLFDPRLFEDPTRSWRALVDTHVALLDGRVAVAARRSPQLFSALTRRLFDGHHESHRLAEVRTLPRVHERVLALLSHLATRWGRVTPAGVTLLLPVTHEVLGRLVGAQRPTVSLALTDLRDDGLVIRLPGGRWLLPSVAFDVSPDDAAI
jgi:CRP/FNR family transcriptional regulator, cyclic AMP receptor protein